MCLPVSSLIWLAQLFSYCVRCRCQLVHCLTESVSSMILVSLCQLSLQTFILPFPLLFITGGKTSLCAKLAAVHLPIHCRHATKGRPPSLQHALTFSCLFGLQLLGRKKHSSVKFVGQTSVLTKHLHCNDDQFGYRLELRRKRGIDCRIP